MSSSKSKLFNLKEWLTVPDSAKYLSIAFDEEVTEADILRLALDGRLQLSANFVNHAYVKRGKLIHIPEAELLAAIKDGHLPRELEWNTLSAEITLHAPGIPDEQKGKPLTYLRSIRLDSDRYLNLSPQVTTISGVWDLPMIGGERLDVEHKYQAMTGGPEVTLSNLDGPFVERSDGEMCQLQESFDNNPYQQGSKAQLEIIKKRIAVEKLDETEAENLLSKYKEDRNEYLANRKENANEDYYPAGGLPNDAVYVVRSDELRNFEQRVSGNEEAVKPLKTTERNSLLTVIAALCDYSAIDYQERGAAKQVSMMTEEIGAPITDDTIRKIFTQIPDALLSRKK